MNYILRIATTLLVTLAAVGAIADQPTWDTLEKQFGDPPVESQRLTAPLFWLHGDESPDRLREFVAKTAEANNGSLIAESRPHNDWLGPGWYRDLDIVLQAAKSHGMTMWIFDEKWWPSQTVAGAVPDRYAAKRIKAESTEIDGPKLVEAAGYTGDTYIATVAGREINGKIGGDSLIDLRRHIRAGKLTWNAPAGKWRIMKFTWTKAPTAVQGGDKTVDGASRDCVEWYINKVYQPHYDRFKDDFGKSIVGFFYDEPETDGDWGTELPKILAERHIDWMKPYVAWTIGLSGEEQIAARYAYADALHEAWGRTLYGGLDRWCRDRGVALIGHFIEHDGEYLKPNFGAANLFQMQKYGAMGGIDMVYYQLAPDQRPVGAYQLPKLGSSISHAYNKADDLAMCEIFGAYGQAVTYPEMKWLCDQHQVRGTNFMVPHSMNPRAPNDTDCPPYFYSPGAEPRWPLYRVWSDYNNRLSLLLTGGRHVCPIAVLMCGNSAYVGKATTPELMTNVIQDALYDCDWIPYDVFEQDTRIRKGVAQLHDEQYRVLIVPPIEAIPYATLAKVRAFYDKGGVVIAYGSLPVKSASLGHAADDVANLCKAIWGDPKSGVSSCNRNGTGGRAYFLPELPTAIQIRQMLANEVGLPPALDVVQGDTGNWLHILHRVKSDRDVFLIANQNYTGDARRFRFRARAAGEPECWDAMRNEIAALPYTRIDAGTVEFDLTMEPNQSALIVFSPARRDPATVNANVTQKAIDLVRDSAPAAGITLPLNECNWVWYPEGDPARSAPPGTRYFRGTVNVPPSRSVKSALIRLSADNEFTLFVNGDQIGGSVGADESWRRPQQFDITAHVKPGRNVFAVAATNTSDNANPAGLIGTIRIVLDNDDVITASIDGTWRSSDREMASWNAVSFADTSWPAAKEIAGYDGGPWAGGLESILAADPFTARCYLPRGTDLDHTIAYLEMEGAASEGSSISVNGEFAGGMIGAPYRLNITDHLKPGRNTITIEPYAPASARITYIAR